MTFDKENYKARFAGKNARYPEAGQFVLIIEGDFLGEIFEVIKVGGYVFNPVYRIYVKGPDEETLWFWPWNIEIVEEPER